MSPLALQTTLAMPRDAEWVALGLSYLLGAVPFSWLLARWLKGVDIRAVGSGNIGSTNASRVLGRPLGIAAFFLDFGKGWAPVALIAPAFDRRGLGPVFGALCGVAAVCGHVWPVYLRFKGGKAVATTCGMVVALDPWIFLAGGVAWLLVTYGVGYIGLASIAMCAVFPLAAWYRVRRGSSPYDLNVVWVLLGLAALVVLRHRTNIRRMLQGTEPKRGADRKESRSHD